MARAAAASPREGCAQTPRCRLSGGDPVGRRRSFDHGRSHVDRWAVGSRGLPRDASDPMRGHDALVDTGQEFSSRTKRRLVPRRYQCRDLPLDGLFIADRFDRYGRCGVARRFIRRSRFRVACRPVGCGWRRVAGRLDRWDRSRVIRRLDRAGPERSAARASTQPHPGRHAFVPPVRIARFDGTSASGRWTWRSPDRRVLLRHFSRVRRRRFKNRQSPDFAACMVKNLLMKTAWVGIHVLGGSVGIEQTGPGCRGPVGRQSGEVSFTAVQEYGGTSGSTARLVSAWPDAEFLAMAATSFLSALLVGCRASSPR